MDVKTVSAPYVQGMWYIAVEGGGLLTNILNRKETPPLEQLLSMGH